MGFMDMFSNPTPFKGQKYAELKKQCQASKSLFEDAEFPAADSSLFFSGNNLPGEVVWKRPKEICSSPQLFVEGAHQGDVTQGSVGNCWFVAASSTLARVKELWHKVIPEYKEQDWSEEKPDDYAGIFHFRFWRFGEWVDVVVDDRLPTIGDRLVFIHSQSRNEFWSALLEKAYAKLHGSYEALDGGNLCDALEDFTGGVGEVIDLKGTLDGEDKEEERTVLFKQLLKEQDRNSLMSAAINPGSKDEIEALTECGLVKGHAYAVTDLKKVFLEDSSIFDRLTSTRGRAKMYMVRLRNPWGEKEWTGAFSDDDPEWENISAEEREKIGLTKEDDGEFWMTFEDFCHHFSDISMCRLINTSYFKLQKKWHEAKFVGEWTKPDRAGGCVNNKDTFLKNPQFLFTVDDEEGEVLLQLTQEDRRHMKAEGGGNVPIGFFLMRVELNRKYRVHKLYDKAGDSAFSRSRSTFKRFNLKRGRYCLVPSTFHPEEETKFMIRIFTEEEADATEATLEEPKSSMFAACTGSPRVATVVNIIKAEGLEAKEGADPYCIVFCEGEKVKTQIIRDTLSPEWNDSVVFYRKKPDQPIKIHIWNDNRLVDQFLGKAKIPGNEEPDTQKASILDLTTRKRDGNAPKPGKLTVIVKNSSEFGAV